ncbi:TetR/AcrR family transcriptional regulator [Aestuariirhabdus sp. Z084]|uniref:TetR/AcrR family transcriptional regulator n=1 Tax=Aestuariirhabdus haliotis TaxID=2918751 RepID=UPI00201B3F81|nr:TetR/AcrR family transcriptional regulator [Aestuariirhabdus haliotis]MCL6414356.1 TetR/AcrR family transcriptional regulator [Aestuariirhabdus haliotis]MCL6418288.1 TetR/AcrR family transcriptional regulator [Aestuariirhabdus haliotis]
MPYSKAHKAQTRQSILQSARLLFSSKGYSAVTVDEVMHNCSLTRGAFYAHFNSKSELYKAALEYSASNSELARIKPEGLSSKEWLGELLDTYLSLEHVNGSTPCPLAFLATDIVSRDETAKQAYTQTYKNMNALLLTYAGGKKNADKEAILSLTSMIIGAVAVARTLQDQGLVKNILYSCRQQARQILEGI